MKGNNFRLGSFASVSDTTKVYSDLSLNPDMQPALSAPNANDEDGHGEGEARHATIVNKNADRGFASFRDPYPDVHRSVDPSALSGLGGPMRPSNVY